MSANGLIRTGVLLSGGGRTLENFFEEKEKGRLPIDIRVVIANKKSAFGLVRAQNHGVDSQVVTSKGKTPDEFSEAISTPLREHDVDLVLMAGFLALWKIPSDFEHRVLNIHPALLPSFGGKGFYGDHVHRAVYDAGVKVTGCTVHYADNEYDQGPIIHQACCMIDDNDTPDSIAHKVFELECEAYPEAIRRVISGSLSVDGKRVTRRHA